MASDYDVIEPLKVLDQRSVLRDGVQVPQLLIQWTDRSKEDATLMDRVDIQGSISLFQLWGQVCSPKEW